MSQEKSLNPAELQKSTSRRSRKDEEGRDYLCGCGKRYLSYPALYTHIKTKHDGRQPEGTQKTGTSIITKRLKGRQDDEAYKMLINFVDRADLKVLDECEQIMLGSVSPSSRIRKDSVAKEVHEIFNVLTKQNEVSLSRRSPLDTVLAVYLWNVGEYVSDKLFDYFLIFGKLLRSCYQEYSQEIYKACFSQREGLGQNANLQEVQYVPIICDCLLRYYIPFGQSNKEHKDINLNLMELLLTDFCSWLFRKKLTNIEVTLKKQYRLDQKPVPLVKHRSTHRHDHKDKDNKESSVSESAKKGQGEGQDSDSVSQDEDNEQMHSEHQEISSKARVAEEEKEQQGDNNRQKIEVEDEQKDGRMEVEEGGKQDILVSKEEPVVEAVSEEKVVPIVPVPQNQSSAVQSTQKVLDEGSAVEKAG